MLFSDNDPNPQEVDDYQAAWETPTSKNPHKSKALAARFFLKGIKRTEGSHPFKENLAVDAELLARV